MALSTAALFTTVSSTVLYSSLAERRRNLSESSATGQQRQCPCFYVSAPLIRILRSKLATPIGDLAVSRKERKKGLLITFAMEKENPSTSGASLENRDPIKEWIVGECGATKITKISSVGGGCINTAFRYDTDAGSFFVKTNRDIGPAMFEAEAAGLNAMFATGTIRVPKPYKVGPLPTRGSYIIMEYINLGTSRDGQAELGRQLAEMHKSRQSNRGFGFHMDNTIGSTPQLNSWTNDWVTFFRDQRLGYQLQLIQKQYRDHDIVDKGQRLLDKLPYMFKHVDVQPCLLHGDLWSGNIAADERGAPVILDPACYFGHNEAEFGMSWCAGFGTSFYNAYFKVLPKQPGFERRRDLYRLYHYLNHYNLFGSSYRETSIAIIRTLANQP